MKDVLRKVKVIISFSSWSIYHQVDEVIIIILRLIKMISLMKEVLEKGGAAILHFSFSQLRNLTENVLLLIKSQLLHYSVHSVFQYSAVATNHNIAE